jgi:ketosteroid isomerase-like protein
MSPNLDLVRSIYALMGRGDFVSWVEWATDPEVEWMITDGPEPSSLKGVSAYLTWVRDFLSAWEGLRIEVDEYRELDDERVLVLLHVSGGRGKTSGVEMGRHGGGGAQIVHLRAGKVTRVVTYFNRDRALADLGLAPEAGAAEAPG